MRMLGCRLLIKEEWLPSPLRLKNYFPMSSATASLLSAWSVVPPLSFFSFFSFLPHHRDLKEDGRRFNRQHSFLFPSLLPKSAARR